jgi:hypothetical protein
VDLSDSIIAKSDQMDYSDFIAGPRVATITEVRPGPSTEQPVEIILAEFDRPWRPSKSMRRVLVAAWGSDSNNYIGRRMTLFGDPSVKWGGIAIGGIRISHVSHITKPLTIALTESKGKRKPFSVDPLPNAAPAPVAPADPPTISDKVRADTAKAIAENNVPGYLEYLAANGAPEYVTDYVKEQTK